MRAEFFATARNSLCRKVYDHRRRAVLVTGANRGIGQALVDGRVTPLSLDVFTWPWRSCVCRITWNARIIAGEDEDRMVGRIGQLAEVALHDLADFDGVEHLPRSDGGVHGRKLAQR
jgi:hypothetical protein